MSAASPGDSGYRADIDGLRALAVLPVVWFHSGLPGLPGGFAGVDVFFVISGYLITGIIARGLAAGSFSFAGFYQRRVRRIAPALLVVLLATLAIGTLLLLPRQLSELAKSAIAAQLLVPNFHFWLDGGGGYFGLAKRLPPLLLHTWSLGVEEQFYLLFPLFLVLATRWRIARSATIAVIALSAALCWLGADRAPVATFFLLPTRAWELGLGAALAQGLLAIPIRLRGMAAWAGLALLGAAYALPGGSDQSHFLTVVAAALGAVLVIASGPETLAARLLALPALTGTGRISYSLYLWHWPVFLFAQQWLISAALPSAWSLACIALSFGLAWLTWRFVEQPARRSAVPFRRVMAWVGAGSLVVFGLAVAIIATAGFPARFSPEVLALSRQTRDHAPLASICSDLPLSRIARQCVIGSGAPRVAIWGDSHAAADSPGIAAALGQTSVLISTGGCAPSLGSRAALPGSLGADACTRRNRTVLDWLNRQPEITTVVLVARWQSYVAISGPGYWRGVQATVVGLNGKRVLVVAGTPIPGVNVPWANALRRHFGRAPLTLDCPPAAVPLRGVAVIDLAPAFCAHPRQWTLFFDGNHPSLTANREVIEPALRRTLAGIPGFDAAAPPPYPSRP